MSIERKFKKYMMATKAIHNLGDISSSEPDLCFVYNESDTNYYGLWVSGFGFFDVVFPKSTTRELTPNEINEYSKQGFQIGSGPVQRLFE